MQISTPLPQTDFGLFLVYDAEEPPEQRATKKNYVAICLT